MKKTDSGPLHGPARVLVVMDQPMLADIVRAALDHGVYAARVVRQGDEALAALDAWQPHLAVVDLDGGTSALVGRLGFEPGRDPYVPVLALTRRGDLQTTLAAFQSGVDDILTVPFAAEEFLARALVVTRRHYGQVVAWNPVIHLGELEIDLLNRRVRVGSRELQLTSLEQSLLYLLAANPGRLLTRADMVHNLWGDGDVVIDGTTVDRHIRALRAKLQDTPQRPRFIATVSGRGYRFIPPLSHHQHTSAAV